MPLPLAPIVGVALRYGVVAFAGAMIARKAIPASAEKDALHEGVLDQVPEGLATSRHEGEEVQQFNATHGHNRRIWLGTHGIEFDSRALARIRFRKLKK